MRVFFYQAQARRDDATSGFPMAFPSLGVAPLDAYLGRHGRRLGFRKRRARPTTSGRYSVSLVISNEKEFADTRRSLLVYSQALGLGRYPKRGK